MKTKTNNNPYQEGDILVSISGYDMTIVEFFEVVRTTPAKVELKELKQEQTYTGFLCGNCVPIPGEYLEESASVKDGRLYTVRPGGSVVIPFWEGCSSHNLARRWGGSPVYFNHCD